MTVPKNTSSGHWQTWKSMALVIRTWHMVFVSHPVTRASKDNTQQGLSWASLDVCLLNYIPLLQVHTPLNDVVRLKSRSACLDQGFNERTLGFSAETDKSQVESY